MRQALEIDEDSRPLCFVCGGVDGALKLKSSKKSVERPNSASLPQFDGVVVATRSECAPVGAEGNSSHNIRMPC
jgi:hypothetical protein